MTQILVIEDDESVRENIAELLTMEGYTVLCAEDGARGIELWLHNQIDLVICDVTMPGMDGFEVFEVLSARAESAVTPFIFLSARAARADVRKGMALGADDFITKPFTRSELLASISTRLRRRGTGSERSPALGARDGSPSPAAGGHVIREPSMVALSEQLGRAAPSTIPILLLGETGVGKEVLAREVHRRSGRSGAFVPVNCAAFAESLLESELFGHEKGAFTGALHAKIGVFEAAEGGTLFLDEVGELLLSTQVKLLRVLEDKEVVRVGGRTPRPVNLRLVAATNRDLQGAIDDGDFRQDLFYRLNGLTLDVPPLRERPADILALAKYFLDQSKPGSPNCFSAEVQSAFLSYLWPGNIRELRNVIDRAVLLCEGSSIEMAHLPSVFRVSRSSRNETDDPREPLVQRLNQLERDRIVAALERCAGNQTQAAQLLGISRRTLVSRLSQLELPRPRRRSSSLPPSR